MFRQHRVRVEPTVTLTPALSALTTGMFSLPGRRIGLEQLHRRAAAGKFAAIGIAQGFHSYAWSALIYIVSFHERPFRLSSPSGVVAPAVYL